MENNANNTEQAAFSEADEKLLQKINPFLERINVEGADVDKDKIRRQFVQLWEYENGDSLEDEELHMTVIALFIYCSHIALDECNINVKRSREYIAEALRAEMAPEIEKQTASEKSADNPFKSFVDGQAPRVDDVYTWRHFLLEHKKQNEQGWTYRMDKCWFHSFFI